MSGPIRIGGSFSVVSSNIAPTGGTGFADRLASGAVSVGGTSPAVSGSSVVAAATGNAAGSAVSTQNALQGNVPTDPKQQETLDTVDKCHTFIMTNMIFDAANMPVVDQD